MEKQDKQTVALIFTSDSSVSSEEKARVINELSKMGSSLSFRIEKGQEGWTAQCNEISGIIAGGINPNPTSSEIESQIRESIYAAFSVETQQSPFFSFSDAAQTGPSKLSKESA